MKNAVLVDARWLEPPEPMERILNALDELRPGQSIRFLIHREPLPLYGALQRMGYRHKTHKLEDGCYEITIEVQIEPCE
ncbi:MAG: DUF2249 domain-containing protein [Pseudomonadota bacterium]|nr:DUF2249 domain-containing protein [Pseudomonadota bacterium]